MNHLLRKSALCGSLMLFCCAVLAAGQSNPEAVSARVNTFQSAQARSGGISARVRAGASSASAQYAGRSRDGSAWGTSSMSGLNGEEGMSVQHSAIESMTRTRFMRVLPSVMSQVGFHNSMSDSGLHHLDEAVPRTGTRGTSPAVACLGEGTSTEVISAACGSPAMKVSSRAFDTNGFPDSTLGTALVSPPDTGTTSPLTWTPPKLGGRELSFMPKSFLSPSLRVSARGLSSSSLRIAGSRTALGAFGSFGTPSLRNLLLQKQTINGSSPEQNISDSVFRSVGLNALPSSPGTGSELGGGLQ